MANIEEIKKSIEKEIVELNEQEQKLGVLNNGFKAFYEKDVKKLVERCEYRIRNLENAHKYASVAIQEEIDTNTNDLNNAINSLNGEITDLQTIKGNIGINYGIEAYDKLSKELISIIDSQLEMSNKTVTKASAVINHDFAALEDLKEVVMGKNVENTPIVEEIKQEEVPVITPEAVVETPEAEIQETEVKTDDLDELVSNLEKELEPIQEDKKELEEASNELDEEAIPVTSVEEAPENLIAPVLVPEENIDLNEFLTKGPESEELESAPSVDEGYVKVVDVLSFSDEKEDIQGPTLSRAA